MLSLLTVLALAAAPQRPAPDPITAWTEDALFFVEELERLHPDPWYGCPRAEFEAAVDRFLGELEGRSENQRLAGFMRLVAQLSKEGRDGHSLVWPLDGKCLPLHPYGFADGWYAVDSALPGFVGARLVALGGVPIEEACQRLAPLLTVDNASNLRLKLALALVALPLLDGVGLADGPDRARLTIERGGTVEELVLEGESTSPVHLLARPALPLRGGARWLEGREQAFRLEVLEPERALYVQYNEVLAQRADGLTLADFAREMVATFEGRKLARLVLDVRSNGGGDNTTFGPLIAALQAPAIDRPGVLFGLIGRTTFSAAANFVAVLERDTKATLLGEPTGGGPNQYGDARSIELPHHRDVLVRLSTRYHQFTTKDDPRLAVEPHVAVPLGSADYFAGRDPVLRAALEHEAPR
jgi:hypothetical protein